MEEFAVKVNNVSKFFKLEKPMGIYNIIQSRKNGVKSKQFVALEKINFSVKKGESLGIIGLNGSGKTTLLRTIAGVYKPDQGNIRVNGRLSPLMQLGAGFHEELDAEQNIIVNGLLLGMSKEDISEKIPGIIEYAELKNFQNSKLKHFSSGMRARLGFSIAININTEILLVDEILSVGDRVFRKKSYESFISLKKARKTLLIATHNIENLTDFCDNVLLINKGQISALGNPDEVIEEYKKIRLS